jgi:signal transduction histidine kinase
MRLAEFISANREPILAEWEEFARTCTPAAGTMDIVALRDHANEMLTVIAEDLRTPQDRREQAAKARGNAPADDQQLPTAAEEHGAGRAESGFSVEQMISEYRALRASVIRLWTRAEGKLEAENLEDLTRFNEAIDQSLAESVTRYTEEMEHSKEIFLAILGHDLRTPLAAIYMSAEFMLELKELKEPSLTLTGRIARSATRMVSLVGDLLDFTRSRLGGGIPIERDDVSLGKIVHDVADEIRAANPDQVIEVETRGEDRGRWDLNRLTQALTNLVANAVEHGLDGSTVKITVGGDENEASVAVHNRGPLIPADQLDGIFNPMKASEPTAKAAATGSGGNLGLGLYIAERIVTAHQGTIEVKSTQADGTTFTVRLPRR